MAGPSAMVQATPSFHGENPASCSSTGLISTLGRSLTTACNTSRAPDGFEASLVAACLEPAHSLSRVLLRAGFQVWFAYFLAKKEGNVNGLDRLLPADLANVTGQIASLDPHESVKQLFSHMFRDWRGKRRRGERGTDDYLLFISA